LAQEILPADDVFRRERAAVRAAPMRREEYRDAAIGPHVGQLGQTVWGEDVHASIILSPAGVAGIE
jgi:hypothetical protein